jgi:hypothetical protein
MRKRAAERSYGQESDRSNLALPAFNKAQLLVLWRENFSKAPPPKLRKELMVPILAYRMQEKEYGGLSHSARKRLREIAKSIASEKRPQKVSSSGSEKGTRLLRSWHGEVHEVIVTDTGYVYRGSLPGKRLHWIAYAFQWNNRSTASRESTPRSR